MRCHENGIFEEQEGVLRPITKYCMKFFRRFNSKAVEESYFKIECFE
jgi:hypothetical protein